MRAYPSITDLHKHHITLTLFSRRHAGNRNILRESFSGLHGGVTIADQISSFSPLDARNSTGHRTRQSVNRHNPLKLVLVNFRRAAASRIGLSRPFQLAALRRATNRLRRAGEWRASERCEERRAMRNCSQRVLRTERGVSIHYMARGFNTICSTL